MEFSEAGYHFIIKTTRKERSFCEKSKGFEFLRRKHESKKSVRRSAGGFAGSRRAGEVTAAAPPTARLLKAALTARALPQRNQARQASEVDILVLLGDRTRTLRQESLENTTAQDAVSVSAKPISPFADFKAAVHRSQRGGASRPGRHRQPDPRLLRGRGIFADIPTRSAVDRIDQYYEAR